MYCDTCTYCFATRVQYTIRFICKGSGGFGFGCGGGGGDRWCGCEWDICKSARYIQSYQYENTKVDFSLWITNKYYDKYTFLTQTQKQAIN